MKYYEELFEYSSDPPGQLCFAGSIASERTESIYSPETFNEQGISDQDTMNRRQVPPPPSHNDRKRDMGDTTQMRPVRPDTTMMAPMPADTHRTAPAPKRRM